jgi:hypothetical protein
VSLQEELEAIRDRHGTLTPALVVAEAQDPAHPLHDRFEWDNSAAGAAYRLAQASGLIRKVRITYPAATEEEPTKSVRYYQPLRTERGNVYEPVTEVAMDPFKRKLLLADMEREWRALKRRYDNFAEFAEMVRRDMDDVAS